MTVSVKYIQNESGSVESVVIPIEDWKYIQQELAAKKPQVHPDLSATKKESFDPAQYKGMLTNYHLDIEKEIQKLRDEWTRNS